MSQGGVISIPSNVAESFVANIGSAAPSGGILNIVGGTGITTSATGNTITITNTQTSTLTFQTAGGNAVSSAGAITFTGAGGLAFSGAGSTVTGTLSAIPNASLANSAVIINVSNGLTGGGSVSLGGSVNIVGSGTPAPTSGNLVLIQSQTASNSASVNFTTGISGYDRYYLTFYGVTCQTNTQSMDIQYSTNGGSSYSSTGYSMQGFTSTGEALSPYPSGALAGAQIAFHMDNSSTYPLQGDCIFYNFGNTSFNKMMIGESMYLLSGSLIQFGFTNSWATTTAVNAFQILMESGNIVTGTFKLYGVVN